MFVMAIEAAKQMTQPGREVKGYLIQDATFHHAVNVPAAEHDLELQLYLRPMNDASDRSSSWSSFRICMYESAQWIENCRGSIKVEYEETGNEGSTAQREEANFRQAHFEKLWEERQRECSQTITAEKTYQHFFDIGMGYGRAFQALRNLKYNAHGEAMAEVITFDWTSGEEMHSAQDHVIHPVTLDAAAQLIYLALTDGATKTIPTSIPTRVHNLWVSSSGLSHPSATSIKAYTKSAFKGNRSTESSLFALDTETGELRLMITGLETTMVANSDSDSAAHLESRQLCSSVVFKPDIETLSSSDIEAHCKSGLNERAEPIKFYGDLSFLVFAFISRTLGELSLHPPENLSPHLEKYVAWMQLQMEKEYQQGMTYSMSDWQTLARDSTYVDDLSRLVAGCGAEGRLFVETGRNLLPIIHGHFDPLNLLFGSELAENYYEDIFNSSCCQAMATYVDLLAHKNPGMKILEVGAGTGGMTRTVLSALTGSESEDGLARYAQYDYTDISGAYFEKAEAKLGLDKQKLRFKILNIEADPGDQGVEIESYDLVIAGLVGVSFTPLNRALKLTCCRFFTPPAT